MTQPRSSSNRLGDEFDAVIVCLDRTVGPIRLPENRADDFVEQFNRTYRGIGIQLVAIQQELVQQDPVRKELVQQDLVRKELGSSARNEKIPGSGKATGDKIDDSFF